MGMHKYTRGNSGQRERSRSPDRLRDDRQQSRARDYDNSSSKSSSSTHYRSAVFMTSTTGYSGISFRDDRRRGRPSEFFNSSSESIAFSTAPTLPSLPQTIEIPLGAAEIQYPELIPKTAHGERVVFETNHFVIQSLARDFPIFEYVFATPLTCLS